MRLPPALSCTLLTDRQAQGASRYVLDNCKTTLLLKIFHDSRKLFRNCSSILIQCFIASDRGCNVKERRPIEHNNDTPDMLTS